jgi:hypothetical protein
VIFVASNILGGFSLAVKRVVVAEIVRFLLEPQTPKTLLPTNEHIKWTMEVIGQAFSLPLEVS